MKVKATEIQVGFQICAYGATFEVIEVIKRDEYQANIAKWVSGWKELGYFGPGKDFNFQGTADRYFEVV